MKDRIAAFLKEKENIIPDLKKFVQNKEVPLNERWDVFVLAKLGKHDVYYHEPKGIDWNKRTLYDNFKMDRHAVIDCETMLNTSIRKKFFKEDSEEEIQFKEYFLDNFVYSFENDW